MSVLVIFEQTSGLWNRMSFETLAAGASLAAALGQPLTAAVYGADLSPLAAELASYKLDRVFTLDHPLLATLWVPTVLTVFIGVDGIFLGAGYLGAAFRGAGILGVISLMLGMILLGRPLIGAAILPLVLGWWAIAGGVWSIVLAFRLPRELPA